MISLFKTLHLVTDSVWVYTCHGTLVEVSFQKSVLFHNVVSGVRLGGMPFPSESAHLPEKVIFNKIPKYK